VWLRVRNEQLAEDLTGEIFAKMVGHLPDYQLKGVPFRAWLYRIAHNLVVDYYRKDSRHTSVPLSDGLFLHYAEGANMKQHNPAYIVERQLTIEEVKRALDDLVSTQREVVILRFLVGLSLREVALALGKTVSAVKSLQHRGLVALREALSQET
jgi:RNA polymerase sigma-70 factor (ECF subfamily)